MSTDQSPRSPEYAAEKLSKAMYSLVGSGDLRTRLCGAHISFSAVDARDFPVDWESPGGSKYHLRADFQGIMDALTEREPVGNEGRVNASLNAMDDEQAKDVAYRLLELEWHMRQYCQSLRDASHT